jgi:acyl carrier protein
MDILSSRVIRVIKKLPDIKNSTITISSSLSHDLEMDSIHRIELISLLELEFDIIIQDSDGLSFCHVKDIIHYIEWRTT